VVLAIGTKAYNLLQDDIYGLCEVVVVRDALKKASFEGFVAGMNA
jgi:hypothetical protein